MTEYNILSATTLPGQAHLPREITDTNVLLEAPALSVMTDLTQVPVVSIDPEASIDEANDLMVQRRVRLLFVIDTHDSMIGVVTTNDILGEKPMQIVLARGVKHAEIRVRDVMTPGNKVEALDMSALGEARVGDIVATMREHGRQHALVIRDGGADGPEVCGVFSAADLSRRLGETVVPVDRANTFAEIEETIARQ